MREQTASDEHTLVCGSAERRKVDVCASQTGVELVLFNVVCAMGVRFVRWLPLIGCRAHF